ncbi:MAG: ribosome biogenesis GTP-binding protein YihA/YsxC [Christensenellales bacterium]|jgi:GTP-binding protein
MQIKKARFLKSMKNIADYPDYNLPEIAVCGKSNVGKSSLINFLTNNFKLAKTSVIPGKTRLINFFVINEQFLLVDLPGYGYAKVSKTEKESWSEMIEQYLKTTQRLKAIMILLDIRHEPTDDDLMMFKWAAHFGLNVIIVATKADKIAKTRRPHRLKEIKQYIGGGVDYPIVSTSVLKRIGNAELLDEIEKALL